MACKEGQFDVVDQFKTFSINLNAQHVNGMTPFDLALSTVIRYSRAVELYEPCRIGLFMFTKNLMILN